jgi:hypothetical protein
MGKSAADTQVWQVAATIRLRANNFFIGSPKRVD